MKSLFIKGGLRSALGDFVQVDVNRVFSWKYLKLFKMPNEIPDALRRPLH